MCGIAGYIGRKRPDELPVVSTLEMMKNRGPDHQASKSFTFKNVHVVLLHSRLEIIDLDERSNQPFSIGNYTIVFNGEIYNYIELRNELIKKNITFHTLSDTEVLLQYYVIYGEKCVEYFEGMWSFAIYDRSDGRLFISRDRFAEKPLYYAEFDDGVYFGSETKFIRSLSNRKFAIDENQILRYMINGYKSLYKKKSTFFKDVNELPYASNMTITQDEYKIEKYWTPKPKYENITIDDAIEGTRHHLIESMRVRLRSDVPLAFCLSGGIDSSSLTSIAAKVFNYNVKTFSIIDSDERYNENDNIMATINDLDCDHTLIHLSYENTLEKLKELIEYHDAPIATITYLIHSFLSSAISENGYRVAFSGTSADELFTGYYDHFNLHLYEVHNLSDYNDYLDDWQKHIGTIVRNPYYKNPELYFKDPNFRDHIYLNYDVFESYLNVEFNEAFTEEFFCESLLKNRMLNELFHEITPVILHEDDLNSMKYSVENRSPFLDKSLFDFAFSIPPEILIQNGYGKFILREAMAGILNDKVRLDRQKKGFNASIDTMFDFSDKNTRDFLLDDSPVFDLINRERIINVMDLEKKPNSFMKFLFCYINIKLFLEMNE